MSKLNKIRIKKPISVLNLTLTWHIKTQVTIELAHD
jgi:hypothetical protein